MLVTPAVVVAAAAEAEAAATVEVEVAGAAAVVVVDTTVVAAAECAVVAVRRVAAVELASRAAGAELRAGPSVADADRSLAEGRGVGLTSPRGPELLTPRPPAVSEQPADAAMPPAHSQHATECTPVITRTPASTVVDGTPQTRLRSVPAMVA